MTNFIVSLTKDPEVKWSLYLLTCHSTETEKQWPYGKMDEEPDKILIVETQSASTIEEAVGDSLKCIKDYEDR